MKKVKYRKKKNNKQKKRVTPGKQNVNLNKKEMFKNVINPIGKRRTLNRHKTGTTKATD